MKADSASRTAHQLSVAAGLAGQGGVRQIAGKELFQLITAPRPRHGEVPGPRFPPFLTRGGL